LFFVLVSFNTNQNAEHQVRKHLVQSTKYEEQSPKTKVQKPKTHVQFISFVTQGHQRIHLCRPSRRQVTREQRDRGQAQRYGRNYRSIRRRHSE